MAEILSAESVYLRNKKRSLDLYLSNHGNKLPEDPEALSMFLKTKILDDYGSVKDLPPPPRATKKNKAVESAEDQEEQQKQQQEVSGNEKLVGKWEEVKVLPPHRPPERPGVTISEEHEVEEEEEEVSDSAYQRVLQELPSTRKEPETAHSLVTYQQGSALMERQQLPGRNRALIRSNPYATQKPEWRAPWKLMRVISGHLGWVRAIAVDPSNEWFVTGAADRTLKVWDLASGVLKITLTGHINCIRGLAVSDRHPYLFSCAEDKMVKCWDLEHNKVVRHYHGHLSGVYCMALHPTLDVLITGGRDATARVWDVRTKAEVHVLSGHTGTVSSLAAQSTDPQVITGSADTTIRLWDLAKGSTQVTLTHHKKNVRALALHPTEYTMASGAADNLKQWKFPEGKFLKNFSGHRAVVNTLALNREGVLVSGADNGTVFFWDWRTGYNFQQLKTQVQPGSLEAEAGIFCSTFDQTGSRLIFGEADKTIKIYKEDDTATPETHPIENWQGIAATR